MAQITDGTTTVTCVSLKRGPMPSGESVERWTRPGYDGAGWRKRGTRGRAYVWRAEIGAINSADRSTIIADANALRGAVCTVTDDFGTAWSNQLVEDVRFENAGDAIGGGVGGFLGKEIYIVIIFQCVDLSP